MLGCSRAPASTASGPVSSILAGVRVGRCPLGPARSCRYTLLAPECAETLASARQARRGTGYRHGPRVRRGPPRDNPISDLREATEDVPRLVE